jgi:O-antigen/teichoic acid export membrane protein
VALAAGLLAFLLTVAEYVNGLLRAQGRDLLALVPKDLVWRIAVVAVFTMAVLTDTDLSVAEALWVFVACLGAALTVQLPVLYSQLRQKRPGIGEARVLLALSGPMWIGAVLAAFAQLLDVAVVGAFFDGETTAMYVAATRISALVALPLVALNQQSGPMIADAYYSSGPSAVQVLFRRFMRFSLGSNVALIAVLLFLGAPLLDLFDVDTSRALPILAVLVIGNTVDALSGPSNMALQMLGQQRISMAIGIAAQAAAVFVIVAGIALDVVVLVAVSNVLLQLCRNVPAVVVLRRTQGVDPSVVGLRP